MQKQQGEDGRLEILGLISDTEAQGQRGVHLAPAIQRMVSLGVTVSDWFLRVLLCMLNPPSQEMYTSLPASGSRDVVTYSLVAQRSRLGQKGQLYGLWSIPPLVYLSLIAIGWLSYGFRFAAGAYWSPLDPVAMAIAGSAVPPISSASYAFRRLAGAPVDWIDRKVQSRVRLAEVEPDRLGLSIDSAEVTPSPKKGGYYGGEPVMSFASPYPKSPPSTSVDPANLPAPYGSPDSYNPYFSPLPVVSPGLPNQQPYPRQFPSV
jgi:hypothetical protein